MSYACLVFARKSPKATNLHETLKCMLWIEFSKTFPVNVHLNAFFIGWKFTVQRFMYSSCKYELIGSLPEHRLTSVPQFIALLIRCYWYCDLVCICIHSLFRILGRKIKAVRIFWCLHYFADCFVKNQAENYPFMNLKNQRSFTCFKIWTSGVSCTEKSRK